ncbi:glutamate carboxypeptidase [Plectosphaerella plurivora]|uniref:Glutamate carboxypeptidase n=1 Tax=Plectosphaerella plurivora TaxID=936078 RepID=A0A9P8V5G0_9PEZI|nr:glutamate carboxypeptidase [Plectosphaerella plurivora]
MPNDRDHRYEAVPIPSYDEAIADGPANWPPPSPADDRNNSEAQSLLFSHPTASSSSRRPNRYRQPTVESDDEDGLLSSDDEGDETAYVRREMQELEIGEPDHGSRSIWGKRMPFSLSLPQWKWAWRLRLPRLNRTIRLPSGPSDTGDGDEDTDNDRSARRRCSNWPRPNFEHVNGRAVALLVARVFAVTLVMGFLYIVFVSDVFDSMARRLGAFQRYNADEVRRWVQAHIEPRGMRACVRIYNEYAHLAGTEGDYALAMDMQAMFEKAQLDSIHIDEYYTYLNYPKPDGRSVEILDKDGKPVWKAQIEEPDPGTEKEGHQTLAFHALSKTGEAKGRLLYANYGSPEDFEALKNKGIDTKGAIALVRYYGTPGGAGLKVKAAEMAGFAGCLIYSDPADDGFRLGDVAPNGRFMPQDGVHRTSVALSNWVLGDPLTPGWASNTNKKSLPRVDPEHSVGLTKIPSLPLSWKDAKELLQKLKGKGEKAPDSWKGGVPDVEWWIGGDDSPVVHLKNDQDVEKMQEIWNVYAKIQGVEQNSKSIIIGNPRDALAFGATGPHSGTAVMVELARVFGMLMEKGWRPLRTIEFMSWDGSQYNMMGSTEYVENNIDRIKRDAYAYINLDEAVTGSELHASGSPVFHSALKRAMGHIEDPIFNKTLFRMWDDRHGEIESLNTVDGDWAAFQDSAGVSSLQLQFRGEPYPRDSSYNNLGWVEKVGDPGFVYHSLMAQLVALLVLELADRPIMPFDISAFTKKMDGWADDLNTWIKDQLRERGKGVELKSLQLDELKVAINEAISAAKTIGEWETTWDSIVLSNGGWESASLNAKRLGYNNQVAMFETALLDEEGMTDERKQFKHTVFGPETWPSGKDVHFPAIRAAIELGNWEDADKRISLTAERIRKAAQILLQDSAAMMDE